MNDSPQRDLQEFSSGNGNPFATPESVLRAEDVEKQWWVPDRPLPRPYPPKLCQVVFIVDLVFSMVFLALTAYEVIDRLVRGPQYVAPGLMVRPVTYSMIVGLVMWSLAIAADCLGLLIRRGAWPLGAVTFGVFWIWLGFTVMEWSSGPLPRWQGPAEEKLWLGIRVLGNLVWFVAVIRYRLWFAEQRLSQQQNPSA